MASRARNDDLLERARALCFDFAGVEEKLSHGAPMFFVRSKGFAVFANDHHGDGRAALWVKATLDAQQRLVKSQPGVYFVPPYVGVKGWVGVRLDGDDADFEALAILLEEAWSSVAPKSLLGASPGARPKAPSYPTTDPDVVAEASRRLDAVCSALDGAVREDERGQVTWRAGAKPFAYLLDNHHRDGIVAVAFRSDEGAALVRDEAKRYFPPAYLAARGWVAMRVDVGRVPWKELERRVVASHGRATSRR